MPRQTPVLQATARKTTEVRRYTADEQLPAVQLSITDQKFLRDLNRAGLRDADSKLTQTARRALKVGVRLLLNMPRPTAADANGVYDARQSPAGP